VLVREAHACERHVGDEQVIHLQHLGRSREGLHFWLRRRRALDSWDAGLRRQCFKSESAPQTRISTRFARSEHLANEMLARGKRSFVPCKTSPHAPS
jgi:hypothetical protein